LPKSLNINQLKAFVETREIFTNSDLYRFYRSQEQDISDTTLNWRIHNLVQKGYIKRLGRGVYSWGESKEFVPDIDNTLMRVNSILVKEFPFAKSCLWDTSILNQWMLHQPSHFYTLIEIEKDALESVFNVLKENYSNIFLRPDKDVLERYASNKSNTLLLLPLISEAPIQEVSVRQHKKISTVTIEKLMVDIFCEQNVFAAQQGSEMAFIYNNILSSYTVNFNRLFRYAARRKKKTVIVNYLNEKTKFRHFHIKSAIL
jgi:hypothetical protein